MGQNQYSVGRPYSSLPYTGCPSFAPHALLLRGTMYILWRQSEKALKDLSDVINTKDISNEVKIGCLLLGFVVVEVLLLGCFLLLRVVVLLGGLLLLLLGFVVVYCLLLLVFLYFLW